MTIQQHPIDGLTSAQVSERQNKYGLNALPPAEVETLLAKFLRQFKNPLIYILLFALAFGLVIWFIEGMVGLPLESLTILVILMANAGLGVWQETKSDAALERLMEMAAPKSWVVRNKELCNIPSKMLVPGDVVRVEAGERIPADGITLSCEGLLVDESMLSGESIPLDKEINNELYSGTLAVRGRSYFEVNKTGSDSSMGKLASLLSHIKDEKTPLEKRMAKFGNNVAWFVLSIALILLTLGVVLQGFSQFFPIFIFAVALAVAAVPESLPAVLTLALALGVERMAKRKAVVRRLSAVEALGSVTVIATDKTGTLTENKMIVKKIDTDEKNELIKAMALVNDAELSSQAGDPLEQGLLTFVRDQGSSPEEIQAQFQRLSSQPFDSRWKYMRVTVKTDSNTVSYLKGAPEIILTRCKLSPEERNTIEYNIDRYAKDGFRALAFARIAGDKEIEGELRWLGLALFWDPPRQEIPEAIAQAKKAGIRLLMITGDHPETAKKIASSVGIEGDSVVTGKMLNEMDDDTYSHTVRHTNIYARVSPEDKLKIVTLLKASGEIVAMTGDGINDAPALKAADVGIAMGQRGSDVSREVADLILLDDNFATIVAAIEEGRSIYENIQKFIRTLFSTNLAEVLLITLGAIFAFSVTSIDEQLILPITAVQILWINLLTDSLPALALANDKNPGVMALAPRPAKAPLMDQVSVYFILWVGLLGGMVALGLMVSLPFMGFNTSFSQTSTFCYIVLVQLSFVFPARRVHLSPSRNYWLLAALSIGLLAQTATVLFSPLRLLLGVDKGNWDMLVVLVISVSASWFIADLYSRYLSRKNQTQGA